MSEMLWVGGATDTIEREELALWQPPVDPTPSIDRSPLWKPRVNGNGHNGNGHNGNGHNGHGHGAHEGRARGRSNALPRGAR